MSLKRFPPLQGAASTGKTKLWCTWVEGDTPAVIYSDHGYAGGKLTRASKTILVGKNIGKINATTPFQQAVQEAEAVWRRKVNEGYTLQPEDADGKDEPAEKEDKDMAVAAAAEAKWPPLPMLAHEFSVRKSALAWPAFAQPKLDGTRCVAVCGPRAALFSRNRKPFAHLGHICDALRALPDGLLLDGELYAHDLSFQTIVGIVKRKGALSADKAALRLRVQLHVYDAVDGSGLGFAERWRALVLPALEAHPSPALQLVPTLPCGDAAAVKGLHDAFVQQGYEGVMLRNAAGAYKAGFRSPNLLKYKAFLQEDFEITGFAEGEGSDTGCVIWVCKTAAGKTFHCRPLGTRSERTQWFTAGDAHVGKLLTVRFQELTDEGAPRFPTGICVRDYEE